MVAFGSAVVVAVVVEVVVFEGSALTIPMFPGNIKEFPENTTFTGTPGIFLPRKSRRMKKTYSHGAMAAISTGLS